MNSIDYIINPLSNLRGVKLTAYNGSSIPVLGKCIAKVVQKNKPVHALFIVADIKSPPVLGLDTREKLSLIKRIMAIDTELPESLAELEDCFGELGCLPEVHHINLKPDVTPVVHPPRRIPYALRDKLRDQLQRMEKLDIIEKVSEPTDWVNSLVIVSKPNGKLRICIDPRDLNRAIKRQHFQLPSAEDLFGQMSGAKYFAKLDMSNPYWQIRLDEESSKLLTFNTSFGLLSLNGYLLVFTLLLKFVKKLLLESLKVFGNCANEQDDIIIWGHSKEQLHNTLKEVLYRVQKSGMQLF